ncbi:hypothetical protein [Nocardia wallacei]|uniref:hypothetical protein n=1 Tax=Nocardia wallacei TaxID=480035 RepID=UPI0024551745|nr:hypothetical protein [Nocardia wallacei]
MLADPSSADLLRPRTRLNDRRSAEAAVGEPLVNGLWSQPPPGQPPQIPPPDPLPDPQQPSPVRRLEIIGCDRDGLDPRTARVIASALDDLHAKYPIPVRGIEISEPGGGVVQRTGPGPCTEDARGFWLVLDRTMIQPDHSEQPRGRWSRRKFERAVYAAVVREYGHALDRAGGFGAHELAWQTALTDSLHGGAYNPLDPARALVDGFTEVVLQGKRAGKTARILHDALAGSVPKYPAAESNSQLVR